MTDIWPRFLYHTAMGRCLLKVLASPGVSCLAGKILSSAASRRIVPWYIRKNGIRMSDIDVPEGGFSSFNDFFTRKRKKKQLSGFPKNQIVCPCDGMLSVVDIQEDSRFWIKGTAYSLQQLLDDHKLSAVLEGGVALIFRLMPQHYHRYCYCADGTVVFSKRIEGKLHCVRPVALDTVPVFIQNSREYQVIRTTQNRDMVHMEIGALLVGKISNYPVLEEHGEVYAGMEKGYFEFGGSTIVLLFEKNMIQLNQEHFEGRNRKKEIPVHMGQSLGIMMP